MAPPAKSRSVIDDFKIPDQDQAEGNLTPKAKRNESTASFFIDSLMGSEAKKRKASPDAAQSANKKLALGSKKAYEYDPNEIHPDVVGVKDSLQKAADTMNISMKDVILTPREMNYLAIAIDCMKDRKVSRLCCWLPLLLSRRN
jgi:hypothetical protein